MVDREHNCHAHGCEREVPPSKFACPAHWHALPGKVRAAILREYRRGQERRKDPSKRYMAVQQYAVATLAFCPNNEGAARRSAPYAMASEWWRRLAIDDGQGDPLADVVAWAPKVPPGQADVAWKMVANLRAEARGKQEST